MLSEVDVFISNYTLVDPEIYQLWVDGHSCEFLFISNGWYIMIFFLFFNYKR